MRARGDVGIYLRMLREARPYTWHIVGLFFLSLLATPIALLSPVPLKIVVDHVVGTSPLPESWSALLGGATDPRSLLIIAVAMLIGVSLVRHALSLTKELISNYTGERLVHEFRQKLFDHAQRLSLVYHDRAGTSDSIYRIQYDTNAIRTIALNGLTPFISSLLTVGAMLFVTMRISTELALIAMAIAPFLMIVGHRYRLTMRRSWKVVKRHESSALAVVQEVLGALRVVQAFGQEEREGRRFERRAAQGLDARLRVTISQEAYGALISLLTTVGTAAVLFVGVTGIQSGAVTLGELLLVMAYLGQLYDPLTTIVGNVARLQNAITSAERAIELMDKERDVVDPVNGRELIRAAGALAFDDVWFSYEAGANVLRGATFQVPAGARVGIVGSTGAGKTTLVNLIARFFDPSGGTISLDGIDLREYRLKDLRSQFTIVLQEPVLFSTSIGENIEYGRPGASTQEVMAAARAANIHEFIANLPDGYDTMVGERGMRLSGGERQRIGLARAFLKDAPIVILDEPTSSVDVATEAGIIDAMERLMEGRTTLMIAHRLSTLSNCDLILEVSDGRVNLKVMAIDSATETAGVRMPPPANGRVRP